MLLSAVAAAITASSVCPCVSDQLTFEAAADRVKTLKDKPSNDVLLQIYALYKQATVGDCTGSQPWAVQVEARAKFDAWAAQKGQSHTDSDSGQQRRASRCRSFVAAIAVHLHFEHCIVNTLSRP